jgi:transcriptional regulator with XRE-family HTH domain
MNFQQIIDELISSGLTQRQIAADCGCGQSTLSEIKSGAIRAPGYRLGVALTQLLTRQRRKVARRQSIKQVYPP